MGQARVALVVLSGFVLACGQPAGPGAGNAGAAADPARSSPDGIRQFHAVFAEAHWQGVRQGFFGCLYGEENLPDEPGEFIDLIRTRFESDPAGFITEKSEGCRATLDSAVGTVRSLAAPTPEIGSARDEYTAAAQAMTDAWNVVHQALLDRQQVENAQIEFNETYAELLQTAGNRGWTLIQRCSPSTEPIEGCLTRLGAGELELENAYRYLNFVGCILAAYDVDLGSLLPPDAAAPQEGSGDLRHERLLRDSLTELCTGEAGQPTHILEWSRRVSSQCYPQLQAVDPPVPARFERMVTAWSGDGSRVDGESFSSYAAIADTCLRQEIDLAPSLRTFLQTCVVFNAAAKALEDTLAAAER